MGLALVARLPTLAEAQIAAGALRAAGVDAEVFDANFGGVEAPVIESLGGFRIMAPEDQAADARQILLALQAAPAPSHSEPPAPASPWEHPSPPRWRVWLSRAIGAFKP